MSKTKSQPSVQDAKAERLREALRENLKKRKQQDRVRAARKKNADDV